MKPIHPAIKDALGYPVDQADKEVMKDWKDRTQRVCKPCWELKYCPYGPLVEQSPLLPIERKSATEHNDYLAKCLKDNTIGEISKLSEETRQSYEEILADFESLETMAWHKLRGKLFDEELESSGKSLPETVGQPLPPIHIYRAKYEHSFGAPKDLPPDLKRRLKKIISSEKKRLKSALKTGIEDHRSPMDKKRKIWFQEQVDSFNESDFPEYIAPIFSEAACNIFGHICPVVFTAEKFTESSTERARSRYISFKTKMRVVRRDNYTCQHCNKHLQDNEVEFDHIIPYSKGGSSEEHNIRLTCYDCNRDKSDKISI